MTGTSTSGILGGIAGFHGSGDEALLRSLGAALAHRGQAQQVRLDGKAGLVARGTSTAANSDGALAVAVGADATDVLARYLANGVDALAVLPGAYALAVFDPHAGVLVLARDGAGVAPLYYAARDGGVVFASEPGALIAAEVVAAVPADAVVERFVLTGFADDGEETFFDGIRRVLPGHAVIVDAADVSSRSLAPPAVVEPGEAITELLSEASEPAVRLGTGLPGAALAAGVPHATVLSASYGPMDTTEDAHAKAVSSALGANDRHRTVAVNADTLAADLPAFLRAQGEPVADLGAYVQYAVAKAAVEAGADLLLDPAGAIDSYQLTVPESGKKPRKPVDPATLLRRIQAPVQTSPNGRLAEVRRAAERTAAHLGIRVAVPYAGAKGDAATLRTAIPSGARSAAAEVRAPAPVRDWLLRLKNRIYGTFLAESFVNRPWFAQQAVLVAFEDFIKGRNVDADLFWRVWCVEMWAQEFFDPKPVDDAPVHVKGPLEPNAGKQLEITVESSSGRETWLRFPVRTELFTEGEQYEQRITEYVQQFITHANSDDSYAGALTEPWYLLVSEKIVAISQGRSYFIWDIEPSWWARTLSRFVVRTPYGIGLGSPWTMELAIKEAGLPRILLAAGVSAAGKAIGKRGLFYHVAGHSVRAIDGPTEYSVYPANVSAKLAPAEPDKVAARVRQELKTALQANGAPEAAKALSGVVVIDANDIGRNVLGQDADRPPTFFEALFGDNPLGQGSEQTPLAVAVRAR